MKLRYLFSIILSSALLFAGCAKDEPTDSFSNMKLSETYLVIPDAGGSVSLTVNSDKEWSFLDKDANDKDYKWPSWLTADKMSGAAGETTVVFSADKTDAGREAEIKIMNGNLIQFFRVRQGSMTPVSATCKEVIDGPDGKTFRVKGVCTSIANTTYGNWYLDDGTGQIYIYGTLDSEGQDKNFASWNLEVGDVIEVEGPKTTSGTTIELVNVTVLKIEKALLKLPNESMTVRKEGGMYELKVAYKGRGVFHSVADEYKEWLSVDEMIEYIPGIPSKLEPNPADTAVLKINVQANPGQGRVGKILVASKMADGKNGVAATETSFVVNQEGGIADVTVADFLKAPVGAAQYKLTGRVANIASDVYGNFDLVDATGSVYVYGLTATEVEKNDKSFASLGIKEGDILTLVGTRAEYGGKAQVGGPAYYISHIGHKDATVAQFKAAPEDGTLYKLTGKITNLAASKYGNFDLVDETGSVYVYGLTAFKVDKNDQSFPTLGLKEGDTVTLIGTRTSYNGTIQVGGPAYYVSHKAAGSSDEGGNQGGNQGGSTLSNPFTSNVSFAGVSSGYTDGVATVNGTENVATLKLGTSKLFGEGKITLPAGTKTVKFYAVAWKGNACKLEFSIGGSVVATQAIAANDGATGNAPYTMTVSASDCYTLTFPNALTANTDVTVKTVDKYRAILFGINASK